MRCKFITEIHVTPTICFLWWLSVEKRFLPCKKTTTCIWKDQSPTTGLLIKSGIERKYVYTSNLHLLLQFFKRITNPSVSWTRQKLCTENVGSVTRSDWVHQLKNKHFMGNTSYSMLKLKTEFFSFVVYLHLLQFNRNELQLLTLG